MNWIKIWYQYDNFGCTIYLQSNRRSLNHCDVEADFPFFHFAFSVLRDLSFDIFSFLWFEFWHFQCTTAHSIAFRKWGFMFNKKLTSNLKPIDIIESDLLSEATFDKQGKTSLQVKSMYLVLWVCGFQTPYGPGSPKSGFQTYNVFCNNGYSLFKRTIWCSSFFLTMSSLSVTSLRGQIPSWPVNCSYHCCDALTERGSSRWMRSSVCYNFCSLVLHSSYLGLWLVLIISAKLGLWLVLIIAANLFLC